MSLPPVVAGIAAAVAVVATATTVGDDDSDGGDGGDMWLKEVADKKHTAKSEQ